MRRRGGAKRWSGARCPRIRRPTRRFAANGASGSSGAGSARASLSDALHDCGAALSCTASGSSRLGMLISDVSAFNQAERGSFRACATGYTRAHWWSDRTFRTFVSASCPLGILGLLGRWEGAVEVCGSAVDSRCDTGPRGGGEDRTSRTCDCAGAYRSIWGAWSLASRWVVHCGVPGSPSMEHPSPSDVFQHPSLTST